MAFLLLKDGKQVTLSQERAVGLWKVLNGESEGTAIQEAYVLQVKRIYLNWRDPSTPQSYLDKYRDVIRGMER